MKARVVIVGGFSHTKSLSSSLIKKGYRVTAINKDVNKCRALAEVDKLDVFYGDGTKPFVLEDAQVYGADMAIALTNADADNLVICELCKKKFNIKKTVAVVSDPKKTEFFYRMGIDAVVCAITAIAGIIEQQARIEEMEDFSQLEQGNIKLTHLSISGTATAADKKLREINVPKNAVVGCILRGEKSIIPSGNTKILAGDTLIIITTEEYESQTVKAFTGK